MKPGDVVRAIPGEMKCDCDDPICVAVREGTPAIVVNVDGSDANLTLTGLEGTVWILKRQLEVVR